MQRLDARHLIVNRDVFSLQPRSVLPAKVDTSPAVQSPPRREVFQINCGTRLGVIADDDEVLAVPADEVQRWYGGGNVPDTRVPEVRLDLEFLLAHRAGLRAASTCAVQVQHGERMEDFEKGGIFLLLFFLKKCYV